MERLTEKEYIQYYEDYGRCIDESMPRKNPHRLNTLKTKFKAYIRKQKALEVKLQKPKTPLKSSRIKPKLEPDSRWVNLRTEVFNRDQGCCLMRCLNLSKKQELLSNSGGLHHIIDPAHVFGKGAFPFMKYDTDNVYSVNRYSHSMLDTGKHPLNGKPITKEETENWWKVIIGSDHYEELKQRSIRRNK